jgi:hypothetical protein
LLDRRVLLIKQATRERRRPTPRGQIDTTHHNDLIDPRATTTTTTIPDPSPQSAFGVTWKKGQCCRPTRCDILFLSVFVAPFDHMARSVAFGHECGVRVDLFHHRHRPLAPLENMGRSMHLDWRDFHLSPREKVRPK